MMATDNSDPARGRLLAVGDIHGYLDKLQLLLEETVRPTADDRVVFLGDYIDRGPDSKGVLDYLVAFAQRFPQTIFLRGNHEQMLLDALVIATTGVAALPEPDQKSMMRRCIMSGCLHRRFDWMPGDECLDACRDCDQVANIFLNNGGDMTLRSYDPNPPDSRRLVGLGWQDDDPDQPCWWYTGFRADLIPAEHIAFLQATRLWHCEQLQGVRYLFVHAGIDAQKPVEQQDSVSLLWLRELDVEHLPDDLVVIHGHTSSKWVANQRPGDDMYCSQEIKLDSGVCWPEKEGMGKLSCCNLLNRTFWQV